jgi:hypothetical protein
MARVFPSDAPISGHYCDTHPNDTSLNNSQHNISQHAVNFDTHHKSILNVTIKQSMFSARITIKTIIMSAIMLNALETSGQALVSVSHKPSMGEIENLPLAIPFTYHYVLVWFFLFHSYNFLFRFDFLCSS